MEGVHIADPAVKIAFIALRYDQDVNTPMFAYAKDEAGNSARADFDRLTFPKPFKKSRIELDDAFLDRVVPAILETTTEIDAAGRHRQVPRAQRRAAAEERREDRQLLETVVARDAVERHRLPSVHQHRGRGGVRRSAHLRLRRQGRRSADAPGLRPGARRQLADRGGESRQGRARGAARHLRQLRHPRSRHGRAVALRRTSRRSR